jgi:hypothetical protein
MSVGFSYPSARHFRAVPAGSTVIAGADFPAAIFATPFIMAAEISVKSISLNSAGNSESNVKTFVEIYENGASNTPQGAPVISAEIRVQRLGRASFQLPAGSPVTLGVGSYWAVLYVLGRLPPMLSIDGGSLAVEELIGAGDIAGDPRPVSALALPPGSIVPGATLSGSEPWQDWRGKAGAPVAYLGT